MDVGALVFGQRDVDRYRSGRTLRALRDAGTAARDLVGRSSAELASAIAECGSGIWLVRAGAWPARAGRLRLPMASDTGLPLCALGAMLDENSQPMSASSDADESWRSSGGDFQDPAMRAKAVESAASIYLDHCAAFEVAAELAAGRSLAEAIGGGNLRVVRAGALDVCFDSALRVVQLVTSLQRGGAERVTLDLHHELPRLMVRSRLVSLGRPSRDEFSPPPDVVDVSHAAGGRIGRIDAAARAALDFHADLLHGHLIGGAEAAKLAARGLPLVLTVHNMRAGWPAGLAELSPNDAVLLAACSLAVEADLRSAGVRVPVRTAWNGIDFACFAPSDALAKRAAEFRRRHRLAASDFVMLSLANPRPQKRLHLLPGILAETADQLASRGIDRTVRLVLVGEFERLGEAASESVARLQDEIVRHRVAASVRFVGAIDDVPAALAAADALVSTSAYEGLSLAHLEALAAGRPVVACDAGGTAEAAGGNSAMKVLPLDAKPCQFARELADVASRPTLCGRHAVERNFTRTRMAQRYAWLYPRAIEAARPAPAADGILLVANNFSIGGAQSSARRLLLGLAERGVRVRAAVVQEELHAPTPGRAALVLPGAGRSDPADAVAPLLAHVDADPPQAVLLWNVIAQHKVLLADALWRVPIFDASPGEMFFTALDRYFADPRPGLPYRTPADYGARLAGVIVKHRAERELAERTLGAPVHVITNGVPIDSSLAAGSGNGTLAIGTLARINPQKKLEELLAALRLAHGHMPPYTLSIAGGAESGCELYAERLRAMARGLPVDWVGSLEQPQGLLNRLDLFVMISEPAGCPNASLEAMAVGLPVVMTDVGGAGEQVIDGVTGRLVPRGDAGALAEVLVELAGDADRRRAFGAAARARAAACFSLSRMVDEYARVCLGPSAIGELHSAR